MKKQIDEMNTFELLSLYQSKEDKGYKKIIVKRIIDILNELYDPKDVENIKVELNDMDVFKLSDLYHVLGNDNDELKNRI